MIVGCSNILYYLCLLLFLLSDLYMLNNTYNQHFINYVLLFSRALLFGSEVSLWLLLQNLGYIIMLSVMLYDAWILISAVIGGGIGYFVFGQRFMKINLENCQLIRETYCTQICGETGIFFYNMNSCSSHNHIPSISFQLYFTDLNSSCS